MSNEDNSKALSVYGAEFMRKFTGLTSEEAQYLETLITQSTPKEVIKYRDIPGGKKAAYVPGPEFIKKFNEAFGFMWSFEVPEVKIDEARNSIVAKGRWSLAIPGRTVSRKYPDGMEETIRFDGFTIVKEQFGSSDIKRWTSDAPVTNRKNQQVKDAAGNLLYKHRAGDFLDLGNDYKGTATDAMKKCGLEMGFFMDVYGPREGEEGEGEAPSDAQLQAFYFRAEKAGRSKEEADKYFEEMWEKPIDKAREQELLALTAEFIDEAKNKKETK